MQILVDSCLALLASVGLWTLYNMFFAFIFSRPKNSNPESVFSIQIIGDRLYCDQSIDKLFSLSLGHHTFLIDIDVY